MKLKKLIAGLMALSVSASLISGCGNKSDESGKNVKLNYVMIGPGVQEDAHTVWAEFNKKLQEKLPGVEVEFTIIPMSEYKQQFMLMQTTKEKMDIVNTYGLSFADECRNGTFTDVEELLNTYGKETKEALPEWLFEYMRIDGKLYGVPSYQQLANQSALRIQKDYAEYLDVEALQTAMYSDDYTLKYDIIEKYLENLKAAGKINKGFYIYTGLSSSAMDSICSNYVVKANDPEHKVIYGFTTDEQKYHYQKMAEWYKKGYIRKDVLSATDNNSQIGRLDGFVMWSDFWKENSEENDKLKYGIETVVIKTNDRIYIPKNNAAGGTAIMSTSKHKEEAMKVINLLQTDKELYNLLVFGIEGTHYTKLSDDRIETLYNGTQGASNDKYGLFKWVIGNTEISYANQACPENEDEYIFGVVNKSDFRSELIGFEPDSRAVADKIANIDALKGEYNKALASGADENWESRFEEWKERIEIAGNSEVIAELQRQVDEFFANKNK